MNFFHKFASTVIGATLFFSPSVRADNYQEHQVLWEALESVGVNVVLNHPTFCEGDAAGLYSPKYNTLVVCQDRRIPISEREVSWTANDYDTLRHEAHHVVQDCVDGIDNEELELFFTRQDSIEFIKESLTQKQIDRIIRMYTENGADDDTLRLELEAFAVAAEVSPLTIARAVEAVCKV